MILIEPLKTTGLLVFDATLKMLPEQFSVHKSDINIIASQFNMRVASTSQNVIDFVKLHYCLSKRTDSEFWFDNRQSQSIPDSLLERLELWRSHVLGRYDFANPFDIFNRENFLYVMYGMQFNSDVSGIPNRLPHHD